jgi:hypothetical protein
MCRWFFFIVLIFKIFTTSHDCSLLLAVRQSQTLKGTIRQHFQNKSSKHFRQVAVAMLEHVNACDMMQPLDLEDCFFKLQLPHTAELNELLGERHIILDGFSAVFLQASTHEEKRAILKQIRSTRVATCGTLTPDMAADHNQTAGKKIASVAAADKFEIVPLTALSNQTVTVLSKKATEAFDVSTPIPTDVLATKTTNPQDIDQQADDSDTPARLPRLRARQGGLRSPSQKQYAATTSTSTTTTSATSATSASVQPQSPQIPAPYAGPSLVTQCARKVTGPSAPSLTVGPSGRRGDWGLTTATISANGPSTETTLMATKTAATTITTTTPVLPAFRLDAAPPVVSGVTFTATPSHDGASLSPTKQSEFQRTKSKNKSGSHRSFGARLASHSLRIVRGVFGKKSSKTKSGHSAAAAGESPAGLGVPAIVAADTFNFEPVLPVVPFVFQTMDTERISMERSSSRSGGSSSKAQNVLQARPMSAMFEPSSSHNSSRGAGSINSSCSSSSSSSASTVTSGSKSGSAKASSSVSV